jgi:hypothetical protein
MGTDTGIYSNCQNVVPMVIVLPVWERHLAAITIEAGRLSYGVMRLRLNGTHL